VSESFHDRIARKTLRTEDWRAIHEQHLVEQNLTCGAVQRFDFAREAFDHPSGTWYWLVCPCGAKHLTPEHAEGVRL
jgi:hypothetical protein